MRDLCKSVQADDDDDARSPATKKGGLRGLRSYGKAAPGSPSARKQLKLQYFRLIDRNNFHKMKHFIVGITTGKAFKDLGASRGFLCNTGLHDACNRGHSEMAEVLGESGADVNRKNMNGNTPLLCSFVSWQNLMSMKSSHGRPHTKKERLATEATVHECVRVLLKCGANPGTCVGRTESGRTGGYTGHRRLSSKQCSCVRIYSAQKCAHISLRKLTPFHKHPHAPPNSHHASSHRRSKQPYTAHGNAHGRNRRVFQHSRDAAQVRRLGGWRRRRRADSC